MRAAIFIAVSFRCVDDVVETIHKDSVDEFTSHLKSRNPSIQFTVELQGEDKDKPTSPVLHLDLQTSEDGSLKFQLYRKFTHPD